MALAVVTIGVLHAMLPADFRVMPAFVFQMVLVAFLVVLVVGDPGRIDRESHALHITTGVMVGVIAVVNAAAATRLVDGILGNARFSTANQLLLIGGIVWVVNVITFALWYWDVDSGGAAARARGDQKTPAGFVFPEMSMPERVGADWFPRFLDYLTLSFNTATAFSPTDVSAIRPWSKLLLLAESAVSLLVALLVLARAINVLPA